MITTGCSLFKNNQQAYLHAQTAEPLRLPAPIDQHLVLGDIKPIPELPQQHALLPQYFLPGRPQPILLAEPHASAENVILDRNTEDQPSLRLIPASDLVWENVGEAIKNMGYDPVAAPNHRYYQFSYQNEPVRIIQLRTQQAIYLIVQDARQKYVAPSLSEAILSAIRSHLNPNVEVSY